jgi:cysteinyl-tRNA synthetase
LIKFFNTLHHEVEEFKPITEGKVGVYSCGPTVYWDAHIGNMYAFTVWDIMVRFLRWEGLRVQHVMNITDVGHLTSDSDTGEDKMEKGAKREQMTVWQVAEKYTKRFFESCELLNIKKPDIVCKATDHISEMIELVQKIEKNGYAYQISDGVYFDTSKLKNYGEMANLNLEEVGESRIEPVPGKKNPQDFALWKFSPSNEKRQMEWQSPWGVGFPGWHIECTAMSTKYLGEKFDIHTGGKEHISVHHTNELAQGEGAFGHNTANFWMHNNWLEMKGEKISKSLGNVYLVSDLVAKGYDPMALRYLYLNSHYRKGVSFSFEALDASQTALKNLRSIACGLINEKKQHSGPETTYISGDKSDKRAEFFSQFRDAMEDDLNFPKALAVLWSAAKSSITASDKLDLLYEFDEVLGLKLKDYCNSVGVPHRESLQIPEDIVRLVKKREELRSQKKFAEADLVRKEIEEKGWKVVDDSSSSTVIPAKAGI